MPRNPKNRVVSKRRPADDDDDSSVDSKGNIRNLIDYDYTESSETDSEELFEMEGIVKKATPEQSDSSDSDFKLASKSEV